jgi:hypothetical protein
MDLFMVFLTLLVMPQTQTMIILYIFYSWMKLTYDFIEVVWCAPKPFGRLKLSLSIETSERLGARGMLPNSQHFIGVEGHAGTPGWD